MTVDVDPTRAMAGQMTAAALLLLPVLAWTGWPAAAAWPWLVGSTLLNQIAIHALLRAYGHGGFGIVYAMARAVSVLGVVPLAAWLAGEQMGTAALAGVALIVTALVLLGLGARGSAALSRPAFLWTLLAGAFGAGYVVLDAQGSRHAGSALAYGATVGILNAVLMCARQARRLGPPWRWLPGAGLRVWPMALASTASYLLILWVFTQAPIAATAALRDTSALWAMVIGVVWLGERLTPLRALALALAAAGVPLLRLA